MIEALHYTFMQRALIAGVIVAIVCAVLGVFLVLKRLSLIGDGLSHVAFGGIALGFLLGINPIISALVLCILAGLVIHKLQFSAKVPGETSIGILIALGLGLGVVIISIAKGFTTDLFSYLFGSILTVTQFDVMLTAILGVAVLILITLFYKQLQFIAFDEEGALACGVPARALNIMLNVLAAITIVVSIRIVGIMLVSALIVVPVAAALQIARSFFQTVVYAISFALISVIAGLFLSYYLDLAAGGIIVLCAVALFCVVLLIKTIR